MINKNKKVFFSCYQKNTKKDYKKFGFTIVELLVVIVIIGILATIAMVSYTGISNRAKVAAIQSDLSNASTQIKLFQTTEASGNYPTANNCPTPGITEICLKSSNDNTYIYTPQNDINPKDYILSASNGTLSYQITNNSAPVIGLDPADWLTIGSQVWAKANLNVGNIVSGVTVQTNNSNLEKYCYNNLESNCTIYGGFYQWDEAMQYVLTQGAQGICPNGSHIPTDDDWKILEVQLGMTQVLANTSGWRGTNQGTQLKSGGLSGLNLQLAGFRYTDGSFGNISSFGLFWSSSESSTSAWRRYFDSTTTNIHRSTYTKAGGYSVRCLRD